MGDIPLFRDKPLIFTAREENPCDRPQSSNKPSATRNRPLQLFSRMVLVSKWSLHTSITEYKGLLKGYPELRGWVQLEQLTEDALVYATSIDSQAEN